MSDDLISRQAAIDYLLDALYDLDEEDYVDKEFIEEELKRVPSVQPKQKTGQWEFIGEEIGAFNIRYPINKCSECGWTNSHFIPEKFCSNCGAKMESDNHDN